MTQDTNMDNNTTGMGPIAQIMVTMLCWTVSQVTEFISVVGPIIKTFVDCLMCLSIGLLIIKNIPGAVKVVRSGFKIKED